ncbi:hypothetical protein ACI3ER_12120 [Bacillus sp. Wb]
MKKYAVAHLSFTDNENKIAIVEATNELEAIVIAVEGKIVESILEETETVEGLIKYYSDGEIAVSEPLLIENNLRGDE